MDINDYQGNLLNGSSTYDMKSKKYTLSLLVSVLSDQMTINI